MKKILLCFFSLIFFLKGETIILKYSFPLPEIKKIGNYDKLKIKNFKNYAPIGYPSIPFKTVFILIPYGEEVSNIKVVPGKKNKLKGKHILIPGQKQIPISMAKKVKFYFTPPDKKIYESEKEYPEKFYRKGEIVKMRGFKILPLNLYPYKFLPSKKQIFYYRNLTLYITFKSSEKKKSKEKNLVRGLSKDFQLIKEKVENPEVFKTYTTFTKQSLSSVLGDIGPYDYIIITNSTLASYFQPLIDHKIKRGLRARIVTTDDIYANYPGIDRQEQIRNFIKDAYTNWGIDYVLLGGDTEIIPKRGVYGSCEENTDNGIPCDMYYGCLDGNWDADGDGIYGEENDNVDFLAEVYVGRAPVETQEEVENFVNKTINYENSFSDPYLKKILFVGEKLWDNPETWGGDYKDVIESYFPDDYQITKRYDKLGNFNGNGQFIIEEINNGVHLINHIGHSDYWMVMWIADWEFYDISGDPGDLMNEKKCFIYSQGCYAGAFDQGGLPGYTDECVGENFVRSAYGAFAVVMNSRYGWFEPGDIEASVSQQFDEEFWDAIFNENIKNLGRALQDSKEDNYGALIQDTTGGYRWTYFELNLFGDPETSIGGSVSRDARVFFDKTKYKEGDNIRLTLMDMDLNIDHNLIDTTTITITTTSGDSETIILTETSTNTGVFIGNITLSSSSPVVENGTLEASHLDTLEAIYTDVDNGDGQTVEKRATATADYIPPVISNVSVSNITNDTATITWTTDEEANSEVIYGTSIPPSNSVKEEIYTTSHSITLSNLIEGTKYYFKIVSTDKAGNTAIDDNSSLYYDFTTKVAVVIFGDDMESGNIGWIVSYQASEIPSHTWYITEHFSHSGSHCWHYCNEEYDDETSSWIFSYYPGVGTSVDPIPVDAYLTSPEIDLTSVPSARLQFWHLLSCGDGQWFDYGEIEITTDGINWTPIWGQDHTAGTGGYLREEVIDLSPYIGNVIRIRFHMYTEDDTISTIYPGWFIDDIKVEYFVDAGEIISLNVNPTTVNFTNLSYGETVQTSTDYFTVSNNGNVNEDFTIIGSNGTNWMIGENPGTDIFSLKAKGGNLTEWTDISTSQVLKTEVSPSGNFNFGIQFTSPTSISNGKTKDTVNIIITATKSQ
ncbi:hypothetical protein J7K25_02645 [bacterium]|nr:hypothetical protein [bacterium]